MPMSRNTPEYPATTCGATAALKSWNIWCSMSEMLCIDSARNMSQPKHTRWKVKTMPRPRHRGCIAAPVALARGTAAR